MGLQAGLRGGSGWEGLKAEEFLKAEARNIVQRDIEGLHAVGGEAGGAVTQELCGGQGDGHV